MSFYSSYINAYNGGHYDIIWNAVKDGLAYITWENDDTSSGARLSMNGSASDSFYVLGSATTLSKTFEMIYTVSGTYTYHDSTSQISDYSNAVLNIDYFSAGALFGYSLYNVSTSAKVATNKKSITFSATFSLTLSCDSYNITGLTWWEENFGPYSGSVTGYT